MKNKFKIFTVFISCFLLRLLPFRAPNVEPIMASLMPISRKSSALFAFTFTFLSMVLYDLVTGHVGLWTWTTSVTYGIIGVCSVIYFKKFKSKPSNLVTFAVMGTLFFDLVTGVLFAPMFGQNILSAAIMQVPFTLLHLAGNIGLALTLSPILNKWFSSEEVFVSNKVLASFSAFATLKRGYGVTKSAK